jgi:hypothetical protein
MLDAKVRIITEQFILDKVELITQLSSVLYTRVQSIRDPWQQVINGWYQLPHLPPLQVWIVSHFLRELVKQMSLVKQYTAGIKSSVGLKITLHSFACCIVDSQITISYKASLHLRDGTSSFNNSFPARILQKACNALQISSKENLSRNSTSW